MKEKTKANSTIKDEFKYLGQNLKNIVNSAWESDKRKQIQDDVADGLDEFNKVVSDLIKEIRDAEATQNVLNKIEYAGEKLRSGELTNHAQDNMQKALHKVNAELAKAGEKVSGSKTE